MLTLRRRRPWFAALWLLLPAPISAANYHGRLCNATISGANATGTTSVGVVSDFFTAQLANGSYNATADRPLPDPSWLVTVGRRSTGPTTEFWLDTAGQTYWDDVQTQFDACAFIIRGEIPFSTMERAQNDTGDCHQMLSLECRQALTEGATLAAADWLRKSASDPNPPSEIVSDICSGIAQSLAWESSNQRYFPQACSQDFGYDSDWWSGPTNTPLALTGRYTNETALNPYCPIAGPIGKKYYNLAGFPYPSNYDSATRIVTPILTVFFSSPNANPAAQSYFSPSQLSCLRITSFTSGSAVAPPLSSASAPPPDSSFANRKPNGLSLAGVLALSLSCVGLVGFLIAFAAFHKWWRSNWRRIEIVDERVHLNYRLERIARGELVPKRPSTAGKAKEIELEDLEPKEVDGTQILEVPAAPGPFEMDATERRPSFVSSRRSLQSWNTCDSTGLALEHGSAATGPVSPVTPVATDPPEFRRI